jgi:hypothetical protein
MTLEIHPNISRSKRQSAVEQTSELLKAYLERWPDPFGLSDDSSESDNRSSRLTAGFLIPQRGLA